MALTEFDLRRLDDASFKRRRKREQARRITTRDHQGKALMSDVHEHEEAPAENMDEELKDEIEEAAEADENGHSDEHDEAAPEAEAEPVEEAEAAPEADKD
jgi:ArsR family metal-binding transcriptional regulator